MNEQRNEAYLNLINQLLTCNQGDEPRILQKNQELLDQGLVEKMIAIAQQYWEAGRENEAQWLMSIVQQLAQALGLLDNNPTESANTPQDYLDFLMETLQKIRENPNPQVIYRFWAQNLDKFDDNLIHILDSWARNTLLSVNIGEDTYNAGMIANILGNFSNLIDDFPLGNIDINKEIAITIYKIVLHIFTFSNFPQEWAITQSNLATAYLNRIRGDKADNLEKAFTACTEALKVSTFDNFPEHWANINNNLACVYRLRIGGERAENLEMAILCCQKALKVRNFQAFPQDWADVHNNLSLAYLDRVKGDRAENIEMAIFSLKEILKARTFEKTPQKWAISQHNLGEVYLYRIKGDKADNLEMAITYFKEALKIFTHDRFPLNWALSKNTLGNAYFLRKKGNKAENLEMAITSYQESMKVRTLEAFPQDWAKTQSNLGNAYVLRCIGNRAENLERAIKAYTQALMVATFEAFPQDWAMIQFNLGNAYSWRINLEMAIKSYQNALKFYTKEAYPFEYINTTHGLGNLYYREKQWQPAIEAYNLAIESVENTRLEALNPHSRQEVLANAIDVFHRIVQTYLHLNQPEKALEYIERSKGRNLVELMTQKNIQPQGVSQEIIAQLNELKQRVVSEQIRLQSQSINQNLMRSDNLTPYVQDHSYLKEYQQALDNFIERKIKLIDPIFSLTQKVEPIPFAEIKSLTDSEASLLQWYITGEKILAFVVSAYKEVKVWQSSEDDRKQLIDTINNYLNLYYSENGKTEWRNQLSSLLQTFADILHINDILTLIPDTCKRLIIIPHWFLHILPLHALPVFNSHFLKRGWEGAELHDLFPNGVQYAPSCQLLTIAQSFHHTEFNKLFAIQNPTKDLLFTDLEVNILSTFFTESQVIAKDNATKNIILPHLKSSDNHCHHFSCHGGFNPANPLESALFLANKQPLTLGEIFELRLNKCRLVTLSACETGLIDLNSISDEYIGLPSGFLFAGSPSVVSSLWTVNDLSTSFLMIKFYEILFNPNLNISVAVALKQAQNWLQNLTVKEAEENLESQTFQRVLIRLQQTLSSGDLFELEDAIASLQTKWKTMSPEDKPFNNPFYWAGFVASGV